MLFHYIQEDEALCMSICEDIQKHWAEETARQQEGMSGDGVEGMWAMETKGGRGFTLY